MLNQNCSISLHSLVDDFGIGASSTFTVKINPVADAVYDSVAVSSSVTMPSEPTPP